MIKIPYMRIRGREIVLLTLIWHLRHGETFPCTTTEQAERSLGYKELDPVFAWMAEYCGPYERRWSVEEQLIKRIHPQQGHAREVHNLVATMSSDEDVFAFKMRWC